MFSHKHELYKSLWGGFIFGIIFPVLFFSLFGAFTIATNRDVLPPLNHPLEIIGCFGVLIFAMPGYAAFLLIVSALNALDQQGIVIPIFASFPADIQGMLIMILCVFINFAAWTYAVSAVRSMRASSTPIE